ncbi:hypothetical protein WME97_20375 [Sorangium sp. So ce367]|uniref:hypothetical protein n=1 Tax=Sorangium sp. So ce367 TaxID=3133305 RepID=UPI003F6191C4
MFAADRARGRSSRPRAGRCALALAVLALTACADGSNSDDDLQLGTSVTIDPLAFLGGDVQCSGSDEPEAIRSYVATLTDNSAEGGPSPLASSPPISCAWSVSFTSVVEGHEYTVRIDGYGGELADQLTPKGGETSGNPEMLLPNGDKADPTWTWECPGPDSDPPGGAGSIVAEKDVEIVVRTCAKPTRVEP